MLEHLSVACARKGCFAVVTLHPDDEARLRRTHETFYCPAGHSNYFPGKTEEQKTIELLRGTLDDANERYAQLLDDRDLLLRRERLCPLRCGWGSTRRPAGIWTRDNDARAEALARYFERCEEDVREHLDHAHGAVVSEREEVPGV